MENFTLDSDVSEDFGLNPVILGFLKTTAKWAKFLSIVGFVGVAFMVLVAFFAGTIFGMLGTFGGQEAEALGTLGAVGGGVMTVMYLAFAALYFFPVLFLFKFASNLQKALKTHNQIALTEAFSNLKKHYTFIGVLTAILVGIYGLFFVFAILGGMLAAFA
ncbi:hypothetical protein FUAX_31130 [Fulvitalea axinellae]|uniref:DUF5362 domain-containing protein n=1 Tax=Fulvitalea axinellae TaxID=1182444 RepID=A0AAU9CNI5_9BACT|nr:hypothetical protein FUAX_31130 [Fulvitalea axinellae]